LTVDTLLCPKPIVAELPLNDLGIPIRDRYRTGDVTKVLRISPDLFRWRLRQGHYKGIEPGRDAKGRLFTLEQIRMMIDATDGRTSMVASAHSLSSPLALRRSDDLAEVSQILRGV
jgi:hypothetical protein